MKTVRVTLPGKSYPILIASGLLAQTGFRARQQGILQRNALVVSQKEIAALYEKTVLESLKKEGIEASVFLTPPR